MPLSDPPPAPLLLSIKGNSLDDGPGIRSVIFFKGCPLSCAWCHNPESRARGPALSFTVDACTRCDACLEVCEPGALAYDLDGMVDRARCTLCYECVDRCPYEALEPVGEAMSADEVVARVLRDKVFYDRSGGGVTFSGGEPTLHLAWLGALAERLKAAGVHLLLETSGAFDLARFDALLAPHLDAIYFDLKLFDDDAHRRLCGASNRHILENFRALSERARNGGPEVLPRVPLIPGVTSTPENLEAIAGFLRGLGVTRVALLPYNPMWTTKLPMLGMQPAPTMRDAPTGFMAPDELSACRRAFEGFEVQGLPAP